MNGMLFDDTLSLSVVIWYRMM